MRPLRPFRGLAATALALAAGCGGGDSVAPQPPVPPPPQITQVYPAARSTRVDDRTEIWAAFAEPLDSTTVNETTVFLKIDALRVPVDVRWESATQRIVITPHDRLGLFRTHTVRLSNGLHTAQGRALDQEYSWQFRTISVRVPHPEAPVAGAVDKGPWTSLHWDATDPGAGIVNYSVWVGPDSAAVAAHAGPPLDFTIRPRHRPRTQPWPLGATLYWAVRAENLSTSEAADGRVGRFTVLPPGLAVDSLQLQPAAWGYFNSRTPTNHPCFGGELTTSPDFYNNGLRYDFTLLPPGLEIESARLDTWLAAVSWSQIPGGAELFGAAGDWLPCLIGFPGPPEPDAGSGILAAGAALFQQGRMRFDGGGLTSYVQDALATSDHVDLTLRSTRTLTYSPVSGSERAMTVHIRYYRLPPAPLAARARNDRFREVAR